MKEFVSFSLLVVLTLVSIHIKAQDKLAYEKGNQQLQLGFGVGATFSTGTTQVPPVQAHYEYSFSDEISGGAVLGYASSYVPYSGGSIDYSYLIVGVRANYHFGTSSRFDPYAGPTLGYNKVSLADRGGYIGTIADSEIIYGAQIGANYYFTKHVGAWAEIGYGVGLLNLGVTFKF